MAREIKVEITGSRWDAFTDAELDELSLSLDHRLAEAEAGNGYVYHEHVASVLADLYRHRPELMCHGEKWTDPIERSQQLFAADSASKPAG